jgi:hypothetical protein
VNHCKFARKLAERTVFDQIHNDLSNSEVCGVEVTGIWDGLSIPFDAKEKLDAYRKNLSKETAEIEAEEAEQKAKGAIVKANAQARAQANATQVKANWKAQEAKSAARNAEYEAEFKKAIADKKIDELPAGGDQQAAFQMGGLSLMEKVRKASIQINCDNFVEKNQPLPEYCGGK